MSASSATTSSARQRLLDAALSEFRTRGYAATTVDDLCRAAGVSKGAFFHHFASKEALALAAVEYWNAYTGQLFAQSPYHDLPDPRDRVLAYIDLRGDLLRGELAQFTCLLGTLVQETYESHPALRAACRAGIEGHADTLVRDIAEAKKKYAAKATWSPESVALYTQVALQGAFVLAKARGGLDVAADAVAHLRRYIELLLPVPSEPRSSESHPTPKSRRTPK